jgi:ABC-type uncharacterized transport system involved in gliding motility auxiliary subunit
MSAPAHHAHGDAAQTPHARSQAVLTWSLLTTALLALALVLVNVVAARATGRADLTEEGLYTLADGTKQVLARLEDPAKIRVFWGGLQSTYEPLRRKFAALLEEMEDASDGRVGVRWVDVSADDGKQEAKDAGVQEFVFNVAVGDEQRTAKGYSALVVEAGAGDPQVIDLLVRREREFEFLVASALVRATRKADRVVAFIDGSDRQGFGMRGGPRQRFETFKEQLKAGYGDALQWWHSLDQPLPDNVEVALVLAPSGLTDKQVFHLEQLLLRGGRAILCLDPLNLESMVINAGAEPQPTGLESWLEHLGVSVGKGSAAENDRRLWLVYPRIADDRLELTKSGYWFRVPGPLLDGSTPAFQSLRDDFAFSIYWPSPLSFDAAKNAAAGRTVTTLFTTTEDGSRNADTSTIKSGEMLRSLPREKIPLALLLEGRAESFWKGKPKPGEEPPPAPEPALPGIVPPGPAPTPEAPDGPVPGEPPAAEPAPAAPPSDTPAPPEPKPEEPKPEEPKPEEPAGPKGAPGDEPPAPAPASPPAPEEPKPDEPPPAPTEKRFDDGSLRLAVIGDADFLSDILGQRSGPNQQWMLGTGGTVVVANLLDWMMGDEALMSLRAKDSKSRAIERPEEGTQNLLKLLNLLGIPVLVGFTGLIVFLRRRQQR